MLVKSPLLRVIIALQFFSLALYYIGPINYLARTAGTAIWVSFYLIMLMLGSLVARRIYLTNNQDDNNLIFRKRRRFIKIATIVSLALIFPTFIERVGELNLAQSLGDRYAMSAEYRNNSQSFFEYVRMAVAVYLFGFFPCYTYFYSELNKGIKYTGIAVSFFIIILAALTGVNKYIFDFVLILIAVVSLKHYGKKRWNIKLTVIYLIGFSIVLSVCLTFFAIGQSTRPGSAAITGVNPRMNAVAKYNLDDGLVLMGYAALTGYLTQGYAVFDMSLEEKFVWTYGVGNSSFLSRQIDRAFGTDIGDQSYPARLEARGIDRYINWSTFYLWWASDVTYLGVGIVIFFAGFMFQVLENTIRKKHDFEAVILYCYFVLGLFYLSANNQVFQSGETFIGFIFLLIKVISSKRWKLAPSRKSRVTHPQLSEGYRINAS